MRLKVAFVLSLAAIVAVAIIGPNVVDAAAIGAQSGAARDWIKTSSDGDWEELGTFGVGLSLDMVTDQEYGATGYTFGIRATDDTNITQYTVERWNVRDSFEWFVGVGMDVWEEDIVGDTKFLGGGRGGIRIDAGGIPFEASMHYSSDFDELEHFGMFFGLRITQEM